MWWSYSWPIWWLICPVMMIVFAVICFGTMLAMRRAGLMSCRGFGGHRDDTVAKYQSDVASRSTSAAFSEYRADTLRQLEEEETEFHSFLDRLRSAKDQAEFDAFMAKRRMQGTTGAASHA